MSDLSELFARDPFKCSDQDIQAIVAGLRARLAAFKLDSNSGAGRVKAPTAKSLELQKLANTEGLDL